MPFLAYRPGHSCECGGLCLCLKFGGPRAEAGLGGAERDGPGAPMPSAPWTSLASGPRAHLATQQTWCTISCLRANHERVPQTPCSLQPAPAWGWHHALG